MQRYEITGMSCAACASHVEKAVAAVPGVASVAVSLLTNSMQVDYAPDADPDATARRILRAVDAAGYGASLATTESESAELEDTETPKLKKRLIASLCFLVPLMYVSMGHMIGLPLGSVFHGGGWHAILYAGTQLVLTLPVCWINRAFFLSGWKGIKTRAPGMDTLVALGAGASLAYGVFAIVMICIGLSTGMLSPVRAASLTVEMPSVTVPSTGMLSPGRTKKRSPTLTSLTGTVTCSPPRRTQAVWGASFIRLFSASVVLPLL